MNKQQRHVTVTFAGDQDSMALAYAKLGASTKLIMRETGLTESQVVYRLNKAKIVESPTLGYRIGYRVAWRSGQSPEFRKVALNMMAVLKKDIQRNLPGQIIKVLPKGSLETMKHEKPKQSGQ